MKPLLVGIVSALLTVTIHALIAGGVWALVGGVLAAVYTVAVVNLK